MPAPKAKERTSKSTDDLRLQLAAIELAVDGGKYSPGPWSRLLREARDSPAEARRALASDVSRVSRKLHMRHGRSTIPVESALLLELCAIILGALMLGIGLAIHSNVPAIIGMLLWTTAFQPALKLSCGKILGIRYDYAYLLHVEPRFKMAYGTYLAAPRSVRVLTHLGGMLGSPLGALCGWLLTSQRLGLAANVSITILWIVVGMNVVPFVVGLAGIRKVASMRLEMSSGGAAALEIRESLGAWVSGGRGPARR